MVLGAICGLLLGAISLDGVIGERLTADAAFDANNVRIGEPMMLRVDFAGAELDDLHPPALSAAVNPRVWKVDDASAKTVTGRDVRRLVYRVRPLREGLHTFPSLDFAYATPDGKTATCSTPAIPVHVKPGQQAALAGVEEDVSGTRVLPDGILVRVSQPLGDDDAFAWRRACAHPTAEAFAAFDFPEARLNEAACATLSGNWAKALNIYARLEWQTGQTPEIERGIVAALDAKTDGQVQMLPAWRELLRPVLRYAALGRVLVLLAVLAGFSLLILLCRRLIRVFACLLALAAAPSADAQDIFDLMNQQMERMFQQAQQMGTATRGGNGVQVQKTTVVNGGQVQTTQIIVNGNGTQQTIVNNEVIAPFQATLSLRTDKKDIRIDEPFELILALERPKGYTVEGLRFGFSETFGLVADSELARLTPGAPSNPSNVVDRFSVRVHYTVPLKMALSATVRGFARSRQSFFGQDFAVRSPEIPLEVKPLPTDNQPPDFQGAVGADFRLRQSVDRNLVETNDVVVVTRTVSFDGILPRDPKWTCVAEGDGSCSWREYFIADGRDTVPPARLVYYDTKTRTYQTAVSKPVRLVYGSGRKVASADVVVDAAAKGADDAAAARALRLRFYPSEDAPVVGTTAGRTRVTEERGLWMRVDDGRRAGWVRKEELR